MFDEKFLDALAERVGLAVIKLVKPMLEEAQKPSWPRWMSTATAGRYIDKTYQGMRYTLRELPKEIPVAMIGDKPRVDKNDNDRFFLNRKGR